MFCRAFMCPSAMWKEFLYTQSMDSLDAGYTKNRKYPMQLFWAICLDDNSNGVILAYVIATVEKKKNWL